MLRALFYKVTASWQLAIEDTSIMDFNIIIFVTSRKLNIYPLDQLQKNVKIFTPKIDY
jgi:hypothetical protein